MRRIRLGTRGSTLALAQSINSVPSDLPMQQDVLSIFITSTIGSHQQRSESKWVSPTGISTGTSAEQFKFSISVSPSPKETQTLYRFGLR